MISTFISGIMMFIALGLIAYIIWFEKKQKTPPKINKELTALTLAVLIFITCANSWTVACINISDKYPLDAYNFLFILGIILITLICIWFYRWASAKKLPPPFIR
jgi:hypothetical protein